MAPPKQFSLIIPQYKAASLTSGFSYAQFIEIVFNANKRQLKHMNWARLIECGRNGAEMDTTR
jgi:hypothetical protein